MELDALEKLGEGREAEIFAWDGDTVLRLFRDASHADCAAREALALPAVGSVLDLAPALRAPIQVAGRPGLLLERLEGPSVLEELARRPWRVGAMARLSGRIHARLHGVEAPRELPGLRELVEARLGDAPRVPGKHRARARRLLEALPDGDRLCHGDYWPGNLLLTVRGPVVIDWPLATRGDPAGDFARTMLMMRVGSLPPGTPQLIRQASALGGWIFRRAYRRAYERLLRHDRDRVLRWEFVRAAERLGEEVPEERQDLLRELERLGACLDGAAPPRPAPD